MKPAQPLPDRDAPREERVARLWAYRRWREEYWRLRPEVPARQDRMPLSPRARVAWRLLHLCGLARRGWRNACAPVLREPTIAFEGLPPALDGFRILHLSDLHYPPAAPDYARAVTDLVGGLEVDLCALTGDYRFGRRMAPEPALEQLAALLASLRPRHGVFAVLGNHDLSDMVAPLREMGAHVLVNAGTTVEVGGTPLYVGGVDDPHMFDCADAAAALADAPPDAFRLLLAHAPEAFAEAADQGTDLYLCGHTHGGQVRVPWLGAVNPNAHCPRAYALGGAWRHGAMRGYTSTGLGVTEVPVRYRCVPEAALITLRRA